ncbi:hypothetical protein PsorP6_008897 [Peronosclerospora sorghi]|uniref:Uncharacterized protein n=1 Tax=Peronosclerospora sorghi TaxID=230839 RepID=A0ACC0VZD3_9STRA|nr:hypothetical protein PsorP6_008897 [Peronosclerospora sorghi]
MHDNTTSLLVKQDSCQRSEANDEARSVTLSDGELLEASEDEFVGYNEWAIQTLKVTVATDFVYEYLEGSYMRDRGVFIAEDIIPHAEVFSIPLDSMLTVKSLQENEVLQSIPFFQQLSLEREDDQLAIALLYEKFVQGTKSRWFKHIELLPKKYHNVLYFDQEDLSALEGSNLFFIAEQMEKKVKQDYVILKNSVLLDLFENITESINFDHFNEFFSFENYKWALSTIWSRFVSLRLDNAEALAEDVDGLAEKNTIMTRKDVNKQSFKAMVPVFDMLNHDPEVEMFHSFDMASQRFRLVSHQHWDAGSQIFINYGALSNQKLLSLYGFVVTGNPFDAVDIWFPMVEDTTNHFNQKEKLLCDTGIDHRTHSFELVADECNELLLIVARIQEIDCESSEEFEVLARKALNGEIVSLNNEQEALTRLIYTLEKLLEAYPTTIEEDDNLIEAWQNDFAKQDEQGIVHERMAVTVRRSDKHILSENIYMLKWKLLDFLQTSENSKK